jgi:hypothetical protein
MVYYMDITRINRKEPQQAFSVQAQIAFGPKMVTKSRSTEGSCVSSDDVAKILVEKLSPAVLSEYLAEPKLGLFVSSRYSLLSLMEKHRDVLIDLLKVSCTLNKVTLTTAVEVLDRHHGGRLSRGGIWQREEAYGIKQMMIKVRLVHERSTTGERLPEWLRELCEVFAETKEHDLKNEKNKLGKFAKRELKRQRSQEEPPTPASLQLEPQPTDEQLQALYGSSCRAAPSTRMTTSIALGSSSDEEGESDQVQDHLDGQEKDCNSDSCVEVSSSEAGLSDHDSKGASGVQQGKVFYDNAAGCHVQALPDGQLVRLGPVSKKPACVKPRRVSKARAIPSQPTCALGELKLTKATKQSYVQFKDSSGHWRLLVSVPGTMCSRHQELAEQLMGLAVQSTVGPDQLKEYIVQQPVVLLADFQS